MVSGLRDDAGHWQIEAGVSMQDKAISNALLALYRYSEARVY
jgi:hypothetical protein